MAPSMSHRRPLFGSLTGLLLGAVAAVPVAQAAEVPPPAYQMIAHEADIPSEVLYSLALQESGTPLRGRLVPWPWTLNVAGASLRFANRAQACTKLLSVLSTVNPKRVDVGLAQVNMGHNGHRFGGGSPCEALNPYRNLQVAAQMLAELHTDGSNWITVAGRYHRPAGGKPAARYRAAFAKHLSRVTGLDLVATSP